jgi:hypothetical protein
VTSTVVGIGTGRRYCPAPPAAIGRGPRDRP